MVISCVCVCITCGGSVECNLAYKLRAADADKDDTYTCFGRVPGMKYGHSLINALFKVI